MSDVIQGAMLNSNSSPTREGTRRRPRARRLEVRRPPSAYRRAVHTACARMAFIERLRAGGFSSLAMTVDENLAALTQLPADSA